MKGIRGFDTKLALEAMVASANTDLFGLPSYRKYGFVRAEDEPESVSKTLEYAYDDWCIAQMANEMGEDSIADVFKRRSESWRNIINPETGFATPRINGDWIADFDPRQVNLHFTEANSWQYSFVQQEAGMLGSSEDLEKRLDALFSEKEQTTGRTQSDITGLIGQYAHGNEPSHHIAYLYNYTAHPEKGQKIIKQICDSFYTNAPDGLIGNEDCGQMSAWYVLSSSGFYSVSPGQTNYYTGISSFDSLNISLQNGKVFKVRGETTL
jgi:predicted alpha-1,2-mannosidase